MQLPARTEYACVAMLELAARYQQQKPVRLVEVAEEHGIPQRFLVQILLQMKVAGLVNTTRGASGGYQLARPPEEITLADIFGVLDRMPESDEKPDQPVVRSNRKGSGSSYSRSLQLVWQKLVEHHRQFLAQYTLRDMLPSSNEYDYVI